MTRLTLKVAGSAIQGAGVAGPQALLKVGSKGLEGYKSYLKLWWPGLPAFSILETMPNVVLCWC